MDQKPAGRRRFVCLARAAGGTLTSIKNFFGA